MLNSNGTWTFSFDFMRDTPTSAPFTRRLGSCLTSSISVSNDSTQFHSILISHSPRIFWKPCLVQPFIPAVIPVGPRALGVFLSPVTLAHLPLKVVGALWAGPDENPSPESPDPSLFQRDWRLNSEPVRVRWGLARWSIRFRWNHQVEPNRPRLESLESGRRFVCLTRVRSTSPHLSCAIHRPTVRAPGEAYRKPNRPKLGLVRPWRDWTAVVAVGRPILRKQLWRERVLLFM